MVRALLEPALVERLRGYELRVRRPVEGGLMGRHRSPTHGASVEFAEHKEYAPGDDLRHVDWRVAGRLDRVYVKRFEERTELSTVLAVDGSRSMSYRGSRAAMTKLDLAASLAAAFAHVLAHQGDPVGLLLFGDALSMLPPSGRPTHLREVLSRLAAAESTSESTDLRAAVECAAGALGRRGLVVLLSDLYDFAVDPRRLLSWLRRRHEVFVIGLADPDEEDLPFGGPTILRALEGGAEHRTDPPALRQAYCDEVERFRSMWTRAAAEVGGRISFLRTDASIEDAITRLFEARAGTSRRVA